MDKQQKKIFNNILFPALIEAVFIQLFGMVDSMMVGHMPNSTIAVAAVSLCHSPLNLVICVMNAFFIGTTATVARHYGAKEYEDVRNVAWLSIGFSVIMGVILTVATYNFSEAIVRFVCGESEVFEAALIYYKTNTVGLCFQIVSIAITAAYRGVGLTKPSLFYNVTGNVVNVVLNYILIYGKLGFEPMYVKGAAVATVISKVVIFVLSLGVLFFNKTEINIKNGVRLKPSKSIVRVLLPVGLTSAAEQLILQSGATVTSKIVATLPTSAIAANQVAQNLESLAWSTGDSTAAASTTLFGRGIGEKRLDKSKMFLKHTEKWALVFAGCEILIFSCLGRILAGLFTNDVSLYPVIVKLLLISCISLPCINTHKTFSGAMRSAGDSLAPLLASMTSLWVFRVGLSYLLIIVLGKGAYAVRWTVVIDQFVRMSAVITFYFTGHWKKFIKDKV